MWEYNNIFRGPETPTVDGDYSFEFEIPPGEIWEVITVKGSTNLKFVRVQINVKDDGVTRFPVGAVITLNYGFIFSKPFLAKKKIEVQFLNATTSEQLYCAIRYRVVRKA